MARGRYPADRTQTLTQLAAAVIASAAAAQDRAGPARRERSGPDAHAFVPADDPLFGAAFGGACAASVDGTVCGWPRAAHREECRS